MQTRTITHLVVAAVLTVRAMGAQSTTASSAQLTAQPAAQPGSQSTAESSQASTPSAPDRPLQVDATTMETMNLSKVAPIYPMEAKNAAIEGDVVLYAIVDEKGKIKSLDVLSGPEILRVPALTAVNQWKYAPFIVDEVAVKVGTILTIQFRLTH